MKTIGLLGGMSWESSAEYYRAINQAVKQTLGGLHSAKLVLYSVDFAEIEHFQQSGDWQSAGALLQKAAQSLQAAGADCVVLCTNTMHKVAEPVSEGLSIPLLHIADATAIQLVKAGIKTVGLLGTNFTMEQAFYKERLVEHYGLKVLIPNEADRQIIHQVIYQELCLGEVKAASKAEYLRIIQTLAEQGVEAVILGCTEIGLLVQQADTAVKLFDTTAIHAQAAVDFALS
ncbi:MAG: aspartate/glutamate racemase family protein [Thiolinea sp.]